MPTPQNAPGNKRRAQLQAFLMMLVVAIPMLAAYMVYHTGIGMPEGTVNKGQLVQPPQQLQALKLTRPDGSKWTLAKAPKKWRYLIPGGAHCDKTCRANLYLTRQVRLGLNEKVERVGRIYLLFDDKLSPELAAYLKAEQPDVRVVHAQPRDFDSLIAHSNLSYRARGRYFLVDQEGFIMMAYKPKNTGAELRADIKRMLRLSYAQ